MTITQFDLATIVASASSLSERLSDRLFEVDTIEINEQKLSDERLDRWCQLAAQGNWESFQRRLLWDGLDVDTIRSIIGSLRRAFIFQNPEGTQSPNLWLGRICGAADSLR